MDLDDISPLYEKLTIDEIDGPMIQLERSDYAKGKEPISLV